jgi:hypothetical protein
VNGEQLTGTTKWQDILKLYEFGRRLVYCRSMKCVCARMLEYCDTCICAARVINTKFMLRDATVHVNTCCDTS